MDNPVSLIDKSLVTRYEIYFKKTNDATTVKSMQDTHSNSVKILSDKIFDLSASIQKFKEFAEDVVTRTDNAMAVLIHELCQE